MWSLEWSDIVFIILLVLSNLFAAGPGFYLLFQFVRWTIKGWSVRPWAGLWFAGGGVLWFAWAAFSQYSPWFSLLTVILWSLAVRRCVPPPLKTPLTLEGSRDDVWPPPPQSSTPRNE
ncbi:MAG: hypothetical protein JWQ02_4606 [Capsulimonas sp.]|jgi:hypothetical protein|nr:hypothetical protein [Capsulimonas sp.]